MDENKIQAFPESNQEEENNNKKKKSPFITYGIYLVLMLSMMIGLYKFVDKTYNIEDDDEDIVDKKEDNRNYIIHISSGYFIYDVVVNEDKLDITQKEQVVCVKAPCNPIEVDKYTLDYKDEYKKMFDRLYDKFKVEEFTISKEDILEDEYSILNELMKENNSDVDRIEYTDYSVNNKDEYNSEFGWEINDNVVTFCLGSRSSGGFDIDIKKVFKDNDDNFFIYFDEIKPLPGYSYTQAITYPCVDISLGMNPKTVIFYSGGK